MPDPKPRFPSDDLRVDFGTRCLTDPKKLADFRHQEDERRERQMQERAAQVRRDALARFVPYDGERLPGVYVCPRCAALIVSPEQHLDWHGGQDATAAQASRAAMLTTPIG